MSEMISLRNAYAYAIEKVRRNAPRIGVSFPHVAIDDGRYNSERPSFWTNGFWPGLLWLSYMETGDESLRNIAEDIEKVQDDTMFHFESLHHDVGFQWIPMALADYRITGNEESCTRAYKAAILLASRFNPEGRYLRAWNDGKEGNRDSSGWAIIDCLMNIPILYWASKEYQDPRFRNIAVAHVDTILKYSIREDGSTAHITRFDSNTGEFLSHGGGQGKSPDSSWARGQGWLIYGMAISYRETGNERYLEAAMKASRNFMERLPEDGIPYWDFDSDEEDRWVRDSSAAAIAASGMLEIASLSKGEDECEFRSMAESLLLALTENVAVFDDSTEGILRLGTVNYTNRKHINVPIIYGDYFYIEALRKYLGKASGLF